MNILCCRFDSAQCSKAHQAEIVTSALSPCHSRLSHALYRPSSDTNISISLFTSSGASVLELCPARGISTKDKPVLSAPTAGCIS